MRYKLFLGALFLALAQFSFAQFTNVTGTVHDPIGLPYANGTISPVLNVSGTPVFTATGQPYTPPTGLTQLDADGNFTMRLADNLALTPSSSWTFIVCSGAGTVPVSWGRQLGCFNAGPITITGSSQDISTQIQSSASPLTYSASAILQDSSTCAKLNGPVDIDTSHLDPTGQATAKASATSSTKVIGVAVAVPQSCIGSVQVATALVVPCITDNFSTVGDQVAVSASTTGECTDTSGVTPTSGTFGTVMRANIGPGTVSMVLLTALGGSGGSSIPTPVSLANGGTATSTPCSTTNALFYFTGTTILCDSNALTDTTGNMTFNTINVSAFIVRGTGPGRITVATGTAPTRPSTGNALYYVDSGTNLFSCLLPVSGSCTNFGVLGDVTGTLAATTVAQVNGAVVPASATALASNSSRQLIAATFQGNGSLVQLSTGTATANHLVSYDANGNAVDSGVPVTSTQQGIITGAGDGTVSSSATSFIQINGGGSPQGTENLRQLMLPLTGTLTNLCVNILNTQSATGSLTFIIHDATTNSNVSGLSDVIAAGSTTSGNPYCDNTNSSSVTAGHDYTIKVTNAATATSANIGGISLIYKH